MSKRELIALLVLCTLSAAAGFGAWYWYHTQQQAEADAMRPDLEFRDLDGRAHRLSEWNGKLLLVNFWATWCPPCLKEIPELIAAQRKYGPRGLQVVGLAMDERDPVAAFQARLQMNYPIMVGGIEIASAMDALGDELGAFPFSVLIAPDGRIIGRQSGALTAEDLDGWISGNLPY